jgi:hypothetical protein
MFQLFREPVMLIGYAAVVTAADMVAGHVRLDISCLDRLYLNGYVAKLQTPGGVVWFFHDHRGKPIVSPALFEPIGEKFRRDLKGWAQAGGIPVVPSCKRCLGRLWCRTGRPTPPSQSGWAIDGLLVDGRGKSADASSAEKVRL